MLITIHLAQGQFPVGTGDALSADNLGRVACPTDPLHLQELGGSFCGSPDEHCKLGGVVNLAP